MGIRYNCLLICPRREECVNKNTINIGKNILVRPKNFSQKNSIKFFLKLYAEVKTCLLTGSGVLAGRPGSRTPLWRFLEGAKSLKRAPKTALLMTQELRLSGEIQNLEKPKNSSTLLGVFASRKGEWPRRQERFNCLSLPVRLHLVWLWVLGA